MRPNLSSSVGLPTKRVMPLSMLVYEPVVTLVYGIDISPELSVPDTDAVRTVVGRNIDKYNSLDCG